MKIKKTKAQIETAIDGLFGEAKHQEKSVDMEDLVDFFRDLGQVKRADTLQELV